MSKFYKKVATPETRSRQTVSPSSPSQDTNARQEAVNNTGGLGGAIQSLLGVTSKVVSAVGQYNEEETKLLEGEFAPHADEATANTAKGLHTKLQNAAPKGQIWRLDGDELESLTDEYKREAISANASEEWSSIAATRVNDKINAYRKKLSGKNTQDRNTFHLDAISKKAYQEFKAGGTTAVNLMLASRSANIQASDTEIFQSAFSGIVKESIRNKDGATLEKIKSDPAIKRWSKENGVEDHDEFSNALEQGIRPEINKQVKVNTTSMFDEGQERITQGMGSAKAINEFINSKKEFYKQEGNRIYSPSLEDFEKTRSDLLKLQSETESYDRLGKAVVDGEHTAIVNAAGLTEKQKIAATERLAHTQHGVVTSNMDDVYTDVFGGDEGGNIAVAMNNNIPIAPSLVNQFTTKSLISRDADKPFENYQRQTDTFIKLNGDTEGKLRDEVGAATYNRMMQQDKILSQIESGILTKVEGEALLANITTEHNQNTSKTRGYTSLEGMEAFQQDDEIESRFRETSNDALGGSLEDVTNNEQVFTYMRSSFMHFTQAGIDPKEAERLTNEAMSKQYRQIENPDNSEVFIPKEFKHLNFDKFFKAVKQTDGVKQLIDKMSVLDKAWDGDLNVHIPRDYAGKKHIVVRIGKSNKLVLDIDAASKMIKAYDVSDKKSKLDSYAIDLKSKRTRRDAENRDNTLNLGR